MKKRLLAAGLCVVVGLAVLAWLQRPRYGLDDLLGPDQLAASQWYDEGSTSAVAMLRQGMEHADARIRARCLVSLDRLGDRSSLPLVIERLHDPDLNVRSIAARTLVRQRAWPSPEPLLASLREPGQDSRVRTYLLDALSRSQVTEVVPDLLKSAGNPDATVSERMMAIQGLLRMRRPEARQVLATILKDPQEQGRLRRRAAVALGRCGEHDVLLAFLQAGDEDDGVTASACLGYQGAPAAAVRAARPVLEKLARSSATPARTRACATRVLLEHELQVPDRFLADLLLRHEEREVRRFAAEAIAFSRDEELWDTLFEAQEKERSGEVRRAINWAIGRLP